MGNGIKKRNAYSEIAKSRNNSGPMVHSKPTREKFDFYYCANKDCGNIVDEENELCEECEENK